ncbi:hypothetical protein TKK_0011581 [Trichogramma kaykai]
MTDYIVDIQGFKRSMNRFVFKEISVIAVEPDSVPLVFHFEAPFCWQNLLDEHKSCNNWLSKNYHGLPWSGDDIPYNKLEETLVVLFFNARNIYVTGAEKQSWLQEILSNRFIENIEHLGCPTLKKLRRYRSHPCKLHTCK